MNFKSTKIFIVGLFILIILHTGCEKGNPNILISTDFGDITAELYLDQAPITASNFLKYIREDRFEGATFYRVVRMDNQPNDSVKIQVIQGGLFDENHPNALPPISHETTSQTGILHKDGVLSMARWGPGTATCEFFICVENQPELDFGGKRNPDVQGFAAFGKVIHGMDIVRKIQNLPADGQYLNPRIKIIEMTIVD